MLFDLRSRGRRRTVQVIYLGLALLMMGGLVLFGVGAGNGIGGLLNAFTNNGSGSNTSAVNQQTKAALKVVKAEPTEASAWAQLIVARWSDAGQGSNYDTATSTYLSGGKKQLTLLAQDWQRYTQLISSPSPDVAILAAEADGVLAQYAAESGAWQAVVNAQPTEAKGYECLAASAYAAKDTRVGNLAAAKAVSLVPKLQQLQLKQVLNEAKTNPEVAQQC
jgi:hypothetical protein